MVGDAKTHFQTIESILKLIHSKHSKNDRKNFQTIESILKLDVPSDGLVAFTVFPDY